MTGHTKEPWAYLTGPAFQGQYHTVEGADQMMVCECWDRAEEIDEANARRIVDCVNALAGKTPAALDALIEAAERVAQARVLAREGQFDGGAFAMIGPSFEDLDTLATALANFRNGDAQ